jgi:hypothetical protein
MISPARRKIQRTAAAIGGASVTIMEQLGHFPMSESPEQFRRYISLVLGQVLAIDAERAGRRQAGIVWPAATRYVLVRIVQVWCRVRRGGREKTGSGLPAKAIRQAGS